MTLATTAPFWRGVRVGGVTTTCLRRWSPLLQKEERGEFPGAAEPSGLWYGVRPGLTLRPPYPTAVLLRLLPTRQRTPHPRPPPRPLLRRANQV